MSKTQVLSLAFVRVPITAIVNGVYINPTGDTVQFALIPRTSSGGIPEPTGATTWTVGSWETGVTGPPYVCRILVGPSGSLNPGVGTYRVWVMIGDSPEVPVLDGGDVVIY